MRFTRLVVAFMAAAAIMFAAEPFAGTWKLNSAKSKWKTGAPPKSETVTIAESGSELDISIEGVLADGTPISVRFTAPAAGGEGKPVESESSPFDAISVQRPEPGLMVVSYGKAGKVVLTNRARVSKNGKAMIANITATGEDGTPAAGVSVYERQ